MSPDEARRVRRDKVAALLRRRKVVEEMREARARRGTPVSGPLKVMQDNLLKAVAPTPQSNPRAGMDRLLAKLDSKPIDLSKFDPKTKPKTKQIRTIVDALGKGCEQCLARPAVIYNHEYEKYLDLDCEEMLIMSTAGVAFEKLSLKKRKQEG